MISITGRTEHEGNAIDYLSYVSETYISHASLKQNCTQTDAHL